VTRAERFFWRLFGVVLGVVVVVYVVAPLVGMRW